MEVVPPVLLALALRDRSHHLSALRRELEVVEAQSPRDFLESRGVEVDGALARELATLGPPAALEALGRLSGRVHLRLHPGTYPGPWRVEFPGWELRVTEEEVAKALSSAFALCQSAAGADRAGEKTHAERARAASRRGAIK